MRLWLKFCSAKSSQVVAISTRPWHIFIHILQSFPATIRAFSGWWSAAAAYTDFKSHRLKRVGLSSSIATSQQNCDNQNQTMTSVKTVHHFIGEDWFGEMVLPKGVSIFRWFQGISSQSIPSKPEATYFRETAWLDNSSCVRGEYSCLWDQQETHPAGVHIPKRQSPWWTDRLKCTGPTEYLHLRLRFGGALQQTSDASNYDFCENCSSLYKWRLVWWDGLAKKSFNFQMVSGYIKPIYSKQTGSDLFSRNGMTRQLFLCERRV